VINRAALVVVLALGACNIIGGIEPAELECPVDGIKNGRETDVDCGGPCTPCEDGMVCVEDTDCANRACDLGTCDPPLCYDGRQNGEESDVDCGGESELCERCTGGDQCRVANDCAAALDNPDACDNGICTSLCCSYDCPDDPCGLDDCAACTAGSLGTSCMIDDDCFDPFWCIEDDAGPYLCL
jgi:hypothetical protein